MSTIQKKPSTRSWSANPALPQVAVSPSARSAMAHEFPDAFQLKRPPSVKPPHCWPQTQATPFLLGRNPLGRVPASSLALTPAAGSGAPWGQVSECNPSSSPPWRPAREPGWRHAYPWNHGISWWVGTSEAPCALPHRNGRRGHATPAIEDYQTPRSPRQDGGGGPTGRCPATALPGWAVGTRTGVGHPHGSGPARERDRSGRDVWSGRLVRTEIPQA